MLLLLPTTLPNCILREMQPTRQEGASQNQERTQQPLSSSLMGPTDRLLWLVLRQMRPYNTPYHCPHYAILRPRHKSLRPYTPFSR